MMTSLLVRDAFRDREIMREWFYNDRLEELLFERERERSNELLNLR